MLSAVERVFVERSKISERYEPIERAVSIEVTNIYELGRLVALRFIEWVAENPTGVVALPTGRTPEYFIKTLELLKEGWTTDSVKAELIRDGINYTPDFPDTSRLTFVMFVAFTSTSCFSLLCLFIFSGWTNFSQCIPPTGIPSVYTLKSFTLL